MKFAIKSEKYPRKLEFVNMYVESLAPFGIKQDFEVEEGQLYPYFTVKLSSVKDQMALIHRVGPVSMYEGTLHSDPEIQGEIVILDVTSQDMPADYDLNKEI